MRTCLFMVGLLCVSLAPLSGQTVGEITGEVRDASGANAPDAAITATNMATNVARSTVTNSAGVYSFPGLTPGVYSVKATAQGFQTVVKNDIQLQVQQTARVDFTLQIGQSTQTIE